MIGEHLQRAELLHMQGRYADAEQHVRQHLIENPNDPQAHALLAACLMHLEKLDPAQAAAEQAIHLAPDVPFAYSVLAAILMQKNRFDEAAAAIDNALAINPVSAHLWGIKSHIHLAQSKWQLALDAADRGLSLDAEDETCGTARTTALVQLGRKSEAFQSVDSLLARSPENADAHASKGWALLHAGDGPAAEHHFREALRLEPDNDFARRGILEALKSRSWLYRQMLKYFLFMSRLSGGARWGIILGLYFGAKFLRNLARQHEELAPFVFPILAAYVLFVILSWAAQPMFNLFLRLHPLGKFALSREDRLASTLVGLCLGAGLVLLPLGILLDNGAVLMLGIGLPVLLFPVTSIFNCQSGWPRQMMTVYTGVLLLLGGLAIASAFTGNAAGASQFGVIYLFGAAFSTFVGNLLGEQVPKK